MVSVLLLLPNFTYRILERPTCELYDHLYSYKLKTTQQQTGILLSTACHPPTIIFVPRKLTDQHVVLPRIINCGKHKITQELRVSHFLLPVANILWTVVCRLPVKCGNQSSWSLVVLRLVWQMVRIKKPVQVSTRNAMKDIIITISTSTSPTNPLLSYNWQIVGGAARFGQPKRFGETWLELY